MGHLVEMENLKKLDPFTCPSGQVDGTDGTEMDGVPEMVNIQKTMENHGKSWKIMENRHF